MYKEGDILRIKDDSGFGGKWKEILAVGTLLKAEKDEPTNPKGSWQHKMRLLIPRDDQPNGKGHYFYIDRKSFEPL
jgi:hypothetical protein